MSTRCGARSLFLLFLPFLFVSCALADEIPVNLKADELQLIEGSGIVRAHGSVEVALKGVLIKADHLVMDQRSNTATAEGHVVMVTKDYCAQAGSIAYDATSEVTYFSGFSTKLNPRKIQGTLYLSAEELTDLGDRMLGQQGDLTTCDSSSPHFHLVADRVEFYEDDKIIGYNVTLFVGNMPALWLPVIYYDLSEQARRNWVYGHNEVEGDYLKTTWAYPLGLLFLDQMEKKGFGHGTEMAYGLGALGAGTLFLYHIDESDTHRTDWVTKINHEKKLDPWTTLTLNQKLTATYLIPSGRRDQTDVSLGLNHSGQARWGMNYNNFDDRLGYLSKNSFQFSQAYQKTATSYNFNYDTAKRDPKWIRASQRLTHRQPVSERIMLDTRFNYYNNVTVEGTAGDERLEPLLELTGTEAGYTWRLTENWYIDLDGDTYKADDNFQYLEKRPELEIRPNAINLPCFRLRPKFGFGYYHEVRYVPQLRRNRDYSTERYSATIDLDKSYNVGLGTTATLGLGLDQYLYSPGDQMYAYRESLRLSTNLGGFYRNEVTYGKGSSDGNSPFMFDKLGTFYHNVRDQMTFYYKTNWRWTLNGGHNWQTHKWFDVTTNMLVKPDDRLYWTASTGWSIEDLRYRDLVNSLTYTPYSFLSTKFSTVSDLNNGELKSGSILYDIFFLENQANQWHLKFSQVYETATDQFKVRDIMVVKDLHCWEMKYTYSDYRKEFSLTVGLKALPGEPIGVSTGRGFFFEGWEKDIKEFKQEGAVQRY
ncbi:MAG: hypothetical protein JW782_08060 [Candidatus Saganbacteria bacterium]|nr:hypothetical protein [Candidatus Saganbacteria bacterium]